MSTCRKLFSTILILIGILISHAETPNHRTIFITADSLLRYPNYIAHGWKYSEGDYPSWSTINYNDSSWREKNPGLYFSLDSAEAFEGMAWFRLHFILDSSLVGKPLAMSMEHLGASKIYLDGTPLRSFGLINGEQTENYDPLETPFIFIVPNPGEHLLAVKYANYNAAKNNKVHRNNRVGFQMMIGDVDTMIFHRHLKDLINSVMMLLSGIFIALCLLHLFMFLYQRSDRSNLYFSLFMLSLALAFLIVFLSSVNHDPAMQLGILYPVNAIFCLGCISFSGFINELHSVRKTRFYVIVSFAATAMILRFLNFPVFGILTIALIICVSLEGVIMIVRAMYKKVEGAFIIGAGLLFFALFVLTLMTFFIVEWGTFDIDDRTTKGRLFIIFFVLTVLSVPFSMSIYQSWRFGKMNRNLALQLEQVKILSEKTLEQEREKQLLLENRKQELETEVHQRTADLRAEKKKSDDLLLNILPAETAEELKSTGHSKAKRIEQVTVMFTDFKNFTQASENLSPEELVHEINACFSAFDTIITSYGIEKIKTIGDAYMCAGGLPEPGTTRPEDVVSAALEMQKFIERMKHERMGKGLPFFELRIGIHTGPVVAGIVGLKKFAYDIWGDTVNIAARMESSGETGKINISGATFNLVKDKFSCMYRGKIQAKNKGEIDMYFVDRRLDAG